MGIMSSIGNIISGAVGAGNVSAGRALGRFQGLGDSLIEKAAAAQDEATKFNAITRTEAKAAANEMMQSEKQKQEYRDRGAAFLMREPIQNIIANINSMTNGQVAIDAEDPNLQAQLGQRLVTDAQNGVANPEQSLTLSFRTDVFRGAKAGQDIFASIYEKKTAPQPREQTPADRQTQSLGLGTAISKATGLGVTGALRRKKKEIMGSIPKDVQARMEGRKRGEPIDEPFKPILTSRIAGDATGQFRTTQAVDRMIASDDSGLTYIPNSDPTKPGSFQGDDSSIRRANALRALSTSLVAGGLYNEDRPDEVYRDIKVLSGVAERTAEKMEGDATEQQKYNKAVDILIAQLNQMQPYEKLEFIEKQRRTPSSLVIEEGETEVKLSKEEQLKNSLKQAGIDVDDLIKKGTYNNLNQYLDENLDDRGGEPALIVRVQKGKFKGDTLIYYVDRGKTLDKVEDIKIIRRKGGRGEKEDITAEISGRIILKQKPSSKSPANTKEKIEDGTTADRLRNR
tara:strand:+ start:3041 stop:4576 length:1536 start_codon:yes stop_codon:yes gene_type:complete